MRTPKRDEFSARCDFCGAQFTPDAPESRTCWSCRAKGAPDQSEKDYDKKLVKWREATGKARKPGRPRL